MSEDRVIDIGGLIEPEDDYDGPVLVVFAIDPGVATGWSAWKVPVALLAEATVARTVARCRHRYGTILRSHVTTPTGAGASWSRTDSTHVNHIFDMAGRIYEEWMPTWTDCERCDGTGRPRFGQHPEAIGDVCEACEGEGGEWDVDNPDDYRFVFVMESFTLRRPEMDPDLLAPVRVASVFMDRLAQREAPPRTFFQGPSDAKNTVTDDRLKRMGVYDRSSGLHARDADRHAILLIRRFVEGVDLRKRIFGYDPLG